MTSSIKIYSLFICSCRFHEKNKKLALVADLRLNSSFIPPVFNILFDSISNFSVTQVASNLLICQTELFLYSFLPFTISEWNKLDSSNRKVETYSLLRIEDNIYSIYDRVGIKLLWRLRLGFSYLHEHTFRHNFTDTMNPFCSFYLEICSTGSYTLPQLCHLSYNPYE